MLVIYWRSAFYYFFILAVFVLNISEISTWTEHVSDMLGDIAIPSVVDSEPMFADDYSKVRIYIV